MPLRNVDATASWSIASTASITLVSEGRSSALVSSGGSGGASMPPGSAGALNNRIPMTDAIDWRVVYRAARPWTHASKLAERNPGPRGEGSQPFRLDPLTNQLYKGIYSVKCHRLPYGLLGAMLLQVHCA